jgi:creatinine amidohydrolase/Fe(II)-dependent formamide hydrolase-like protein/sterol desaturase/sphingolipid hydroxylase (fatty acid hydroxylase superfamily)
MTPIVSTLMQPLDFFISVNERVYWIYLLSFFTIAFSLRFFYKTASTESSSLIAFIFPKRIVFHPSALNDYSFFYANVLLQKAFVLTWFSSLSLVVSNSVQNWLQSTIPSWQGLLSEKNQFLAIAFTIILVLAADFAVFLGHYFQHKLPLLWEFHKVHHSARVLTPITVYRMHPVDDILNFSLGGFFSGTALALVLFLSAGKINVYNVAGSNLIYILFYLFGYNLRHSHVWLSYGKFWSKIFISPAQHQIHHSEKVEHFDKNFGLLFAFWDNCFNTLYIPEKKEPINFGLGEVENKKFATFWSLYLMPFVNIAKNFQFSMLLQPKRYLSILVFTTIVAPAIYINNSKTAPLSLPDQVFIEDMTWLEVKEAINQGFKTVIIPTGGTEQNGTHMVLGKHNFIVKYTAGKIAEKLGKALVAPVIAYVPEGEISPATGHMRFAGTLSVSETVFAQTLEQTADSLKQHGFKIIAFVGDSGGNQAAQQHVAVKLNALWQNQGVKVLHVNRYYDLAQQLAYLNNNGFSALEIGQHAGIRDTSELMAVHPQGIRTALLTNHSKNDVTTTGSDGDTTKAAPIIGQHLLELKISAAVEQIRPLMSVNK